MIDVKLNKENCSSFNNKYGANATKEFHKILCETGKLSTVADHFGFTRANASTVYKQLYLISFVTFKRLRHKALKKARGE